MDHTSQRRTSGTSTSRTRTSRTRASRPLLLLVAVPLLVAGLAGCSTSHDSGSGSGNDSHDGGSGDDTTTSSVTAKAHEWDLAQAKCMRAAGFDVPDPDASGRKTMPISADMDLHALSAAIEDCNGKADEQVGKRPVTEAERQQREQVEQRAAERNDCLRSHGVEVEDSTPTEEGAAVNMTPPENVPADVAEACGLGTMTAPGGGR